MPYLIDDVLESYTFFLFVCSIRGYTCFELFTHKHSKFERIYRTGNKINVPNSYAYKIRKVGAMKRLLLIMYKCVRTSIKTSINMVRKKYLFWYAYGISYWCVADIFLYNTPYYPIPINDIQVFLHTSSHPTHTQVISSIPCSLFTLLSLLCIHPMSLPPQLPVSIVLITYHEIYHILPTLTSSQAPCTHLVSPPQPTTTFPYHQLLGSNVTFHPSCAEDAHSLNITHISTTYHARHIDISMLISKTQATRVRS